MDLTQIRHFLSLAHTLNLTRAAEACHVTQPALTKSIQRLEEELGGPLLLRERALTQLTPLGATMLPLLEQAHAAAERAKKHAAGMRLQTASPLRVGFAPDVPAAAFMPLFEELAAWLPGFELSLVDTGSARLCEALLHGALDAAVVTGGAVLPGRLNRWTLFTNRAALMMPPGHALAAADAVPLAAPDGLHRRPVAGPAAHDVVLVAVAGRPAVHAADTFIKLARAREWSRAPAAADYRGLRRQQRRAGAAMENRDADAG